MGLSTSPELWGKCRECQSQAELIAGKEATDGGCALESALGSPHSLLHSTLLNFGPLPGPPLWPLAPHLCSSGSSAPPEIRAFWSFFLPGSGEEERRGVCFVVFPASWRTSIFVCSEAARIYGFSPHPPIPCTPPLHPLHPTRRHRTPFLPVFPRFLSFFRAFTANRIYNASASGLNR